METVRIALVGLGTVGASVFTLLSRNADSLARRIGARIEVAYVGVRDPSKKRTVGPAAHLVAGYREILDDPGIQIVIEMVGGIDVPLALIREALSRGKHVITATRPCSPCTGRSFSTLPARRAWS